MKGLGWVALNVALPLCLGVLAVGGIAGSMTTAAGGALGAIFCAGVAWIGDHADELDRDDEPPPAGGGS